MAKYMKTLACLFSAIYFFVLCAVVLLVPTNEPVSIIPVILLLLLAAFALFGLFFSIGKILELLQSAQEAQEKMTELLRDIHNAVCDKAACPADEEPAPALPASDVVPETVDEYTIRCPRCGTELRKEITRCFYCGATFRKPD